MSLEVEQKFPIADLGALRQRLASLGARFREPVDQADTYFGHPVRSFAQTDEALRLRQVGLENCITYKGPKLDRQTKTRREIEVPFEPGGASFQQLTELLQALGFAPVATVRKRRELGHLAWQGREVEIALDDVTGVGTFVELELLVAENDLNAARDSILALGKELQFGEPERRSYLELFLDKSSKALA